MRECIFVFVRGSYGREITRDKMWRCVCLIGYVSQHDTGQTMKVEQYSLQAPFLHNNNSLVESSTDFPYFTFI